MYEIQIVDNSTGKIIVMLRPILEQGSDAEYEMIDQTGIERRVSVFQVPIKYDNFFYKPE